MATHPSRHLWPALQRRFNDQNKPSTAPDRLLRGLCIVPLEGQEEATTWNLGFKEVGSTLRTPSLSRDFVSVSKMVDPEVPCYLAVYVGDVQQTLEAGRPSAAASGMQEPRDWILISYVPSTSSSFEAKKMADNRAGLKTGLNAERFVDGGMWCVHVEQISLSNYMRSAEGGGSVDVTDVGAAGAPAEVQLGAAAKAQPVAMRQPVDTEEAMGWSTMPGMTESLSGLSGKAPTDATEAIWEQRIKNVRSAYVDSCSRLVGALEELEETLCSVSGQPYRPDEPILRARMHMQKNLEAMQLVQH